MKARSSLVLLSIVAAVIMLAGVVRAEVYCCACNNCPMEPLRQCAQFEATGAGDSASLCQAQCAARGCDTRGVSEGPCALDPACFPVPAPTTSYAGLLVVGIGLAGGGAYVMRRRRA